jgi:integrase
MNLLDRPEMGSAALAENDHGSHRGEVSALRWRHVDSDRAILWVHRSNAQTKAGIKEKETKTGQRRKVTLDPHTIGLLNRHRELWEQRCSTSAVVRIPTHSCSPPLPTAPPHTPQGKSVSDTVE